MLEALAVEGRPARGGAEQKALAMISPANHIWSPMRWNPNIE